MVGQKKLLDKLNSYSIDNFPRSILLLGENGCGKHLVADYISSQILHLSLKDITNDISDEFLNEIYTSPTPRVYLIDMTQMTEKASNVLLKFIEEPLNNSFIILISESRNGMLDTILNRCVQLEFEAYSKDELATFIKSDKNKDLILDCIRTPGKILNMNLDYLPDLYALCDNIINKLGIANYLNALTIADKLNYKDEYNKFDVNLFFDVLTSRLYNTYLISGEERIYNMYILTVESRKKLIDKRINKDLFMQNFLSKLWKTARR